VTIGRLVECKAVDLLLEALAGIQAEVHLSIVGDGPERSHLESVDERLGLSARVTFHGFLRQDGCRAVMRESDIFVLPSLHECGGAVVLEAMACGLPIIAANWGGPQDYLADGWGILVETDDKYVLNLQQAINALIHDPHRRRELANRGRAHVCHAYDWIATNDAAV
jgi:glycosyltransferase involved in cell wall biosynthesis